MKVIKDISKNDAYYPFRDALIGLEITYESLDSYNNKGWWSGSVRTMDKVKIDEDKLPTNEFFFYAVKIDEK